LHGSAWPPARKDSPLAADAVICAAYSALSRRDLTAQEQVMADTRVALVTGSTSGIGLGIARALAAQGHTVVLNGFGEVAAIDALRRELAAGSATIDYDPADMSKPADIERCVADVQARHGRLDILVANAGIQHTARVEVFPAERWDAILAINLSAAFHLARAAHRRRQHTLPSAADRRRRILDQPRYALRSVNDGPPSAGPESKQQEHTCTCWLHDVP
jgi:NAD(P)-dependent dehydrogenase (short-subunit alcohol dehydrogenase family)